MSETKAPEAQRQYLQSMAVLSPCARYRYKLGRQLASAGPTMLVVGLNPSTADADIDDPTIRRCVGFARREGCAWLLMGNLHAWRATDPRGLLTADDAVGDDNPRHLQEMAEQADLIVAAWGANRLHGQASTLAKWLLALDKTRCFGQTKSGAPKHPLYLRSDSPLVAVHV